MMLQVITAVVSAHIAARPGFANAFSTLHSPHLTSPLISSTTIFSSDITENTPIDDSTGNDVEVIKDSSNRRIFLSEFLLSTITTLSFPLLTFAPPKADAATSPVQRAVGAAESQCRKDGNCLEIGELDGAVGWNWGGTERCAAGDPLCASDGRLREVPLRGAPVPTTSSWEGDANNLEITHVVEMGMTIGSGSNAETQSLKIGLYGKACPESVQEMVDLCGKSGIVTSQNLLLGAPARLSMGGALTYILPEERLEFGIPSQKVAYAKSIRKAKAPEEFVPQPRPSGSRLEKVRIESSARLHNVAGLISIPKEGIGYGGALLLKDDEAYGAAFQITASGVPVMDKEGRKVIGQLMDESSMDVLARLAGSPTKKMIPGQIGGASLVKVVVDNCLVTSVGEAYDIMDSK